MNLLSWNTFSLHLSFVTLRYLNLWAAEQELKHCFRIHYLKINWHSFNNALFRWAATEINNMDLGLVVKPNTTALLCGSLEYKLIRVYCNINRLHILWLCLSYTAHDLMNFAGCPHSVWWSLWMKLTLMDARTWTSFHQSGSRAPTENYAGGHQAHCSM